MSRHLSAALLFTGSIVAASCSSGDTLQKAAPRVESPSPSPRNATSLAGAWRPSARPAGAPTGSEWVTITTFDGSPLTAAVFAPAGTGPAPVAIYLYFNQPEMNTNVGLLQRDLDFVASLAKEGFLAVTVCWQAATVGADDFCGPNLPRSGGDVIKDLAVVADAVRTFPRARADRVALLARSAAANPALLAAARGARVSSVVSISASYG